MSNVFKKLISKELGEVNYHRYSTFVRRNIESRASDSQTIYNDMYEKLKYRDIKAITKMHNRLNDTMLLAFRISRNFLFSFVIYLIATIFLIVRDISPEITVVAIGMVNLCFIYKAYEFIANKFCYIDAQIVLVYKTVLDRIILNERRTMQRKS
ncbi:MAG: putative rane protein [Herbinix sp.]|nr:putative rane protein [Herbinix sp.]